MPPLSVADIQYPVLYLSAVGVGTAGSAPELCRISPSVVRAGFFENLSLVSVDGQAFEVTNAEIAAPLSGLGRWWAGLFDLPVRARLEIRPMPSPTVAALRARMFTEFTREPEALEEGTGRTVDWWQHHLSQATTTGDLVRRFATGVAAG